MAAMHALSDPLDLRRGPRWPHRIALAPLTNWQNHADGTLGEDEYRWLTMRAPDSRRQPELRRASTLGRGLYRCRRDGVEATPNELARDADQQQRTADQHDLAQTLLVVEQIKAAQTLR